MNDSEDLKASDVAKRKKTLSNAQCTRLIIFGKYRFIVDIHLPGRQLVTHCVGGHLTDLMVSSLSQITLSLSDNLENAERLRETQSQ